MLKSRTPIPSPLRTPLDAWKRGFRFQEIFSETRMKPGISRDLAYSLRVMGFKGSPVRAERHGALEDPHVLRETSEDRRRRPQLNPTVPTWDKVYSLRALDALGEFPFFGGSNTWLQYVGREDSSRTLGFGLPVLLAATDRSPPR